MALVLHPGLGFHLASIPVDRLDEWQSQAFKSCQGNQFDYSDAVIFERACFGPGTMRRYLRDAPYPTKSLACMEKHPSGA